MTVPGQRMMERLLRLGKLVIDEMQIPQLLIADIGKIMHHEHVVAEVALLDAPRLSLRRCDRCPSIFPPLLQIRHPVVTGSIILIDTPKCVFRRLPLLQDALQLLQGLTRFFPFDQILRWSQMRINLRFLHPDSSFLAATGSTSPDKQILPL